eukprot:1385200-Prorocentrum_lima.AAC.1
MCIRDRNGFICATAQFERLRQKSIDDDKLMKMCGHRLGRTLVNQRARFHLKTWCTTNTSTI